MAAAAVGAAAPGEAPGRREGARRSLRRQSYDVGVCDSPHESMVNERLLGRVQAPPPRAGRRQTPAARA